MDRPTYRSALRVRPFRLLLTAHGTGTVAQLMITLALGIEVLDRTRSGWWVSVTVALGFLPYVLASGFAGLLADRRSRSAVLTGSLLARTGCAAGLAVGLPLNWPVPLLVAVGATAAFLATPAYPALTAATVQTVPPAALPAANALVTGVVNLTWMAGPGLLGVVLMVGSGPAVGAAAATGLFLAGAAIAARVRLTRPARPEVTDRNATTALLAAGLRVVVRVPAARRATTVAVIDNFLYGYLTVALVLIADESLGGSRAIGALNAALSIGGLLAVLVATWVAARCRPPTLLTTAVAGFGAAVLGAGLTSEIAVALPMVGLAGATALLAEVTAVTMLQAATPGELTARVFGVYDQLNVGAIALGSLLAGPLADRLGSRWSIVTVATVCVLLATVAARRLRTRGRHRATSRPAGSPSAHRRRPAGAGLPSAPPRYQERVADV